MALKRVEITLEHAHSLYRRLDMAPLVLLQRGVISVLSGGIRESAAECGSRIPDHSPMRSNANLLTHVQHGARRTTGSLPRADMFAEGHEQPVDFNPVSTWQFCFEDSQGALRSRGGHITPAVRHTVDVDVHANEWLITGDAQRQVCTLRPYSGKREQNLPVAR